LFILEAAPSPEGAVVDSTFLSNNLSLLSTACSYPSCKILHAFLCGVELYMELITCFCFTLSYDVQVWDCLCSWETNEEKRTILQKWSICSVFSLRFVVTLLWRCAMKTWTNSMMLPFKSLLSL
jgi:hypothetical protein